MNEAVTNCLFFLNGNWSWKSNNKYAIVSKTLADKVEAEDKQFRGQKPKNTLTLDSVTLKTSTLPKFCSTQYCCQLCNYYGPSHSYSWWDSKFSFWRWACWQHLIFIHVVTGLCFSPLDNLKCSVLARLGHIFAFCMYLFFLHCSYCTIK